MKHCIEIAKHINKVRGSNYIFLFTSGQQMVLLLIKYKCNFTVEIIKIILHTLQKTLNTEELIN